jgi:hypothetical protein
MPDPIPRNRSAGRSRPRRLTRRPRDWPGRPFRQRRENPEQPAPPPAQPRPPAHQQRTQWAGGLGQPFGQRRGNAEWSEPAPVPAPIPAQPRPPAEVRRPAHRQRAEGIGLGWPFGQRHENGERSEPPPPPVSAQPRPPAQRRRPAHRQRVRPRGPLRQRQGNVQRPGPRAPRLRLTRSNSQVVVGVLLCAVAALAVGIVVPPLLSADTPSGSVVAASTDGQAGVVAEGSGDPGQVGGEFAAPPAAPGADSVQTQPAPALVGNRTAVPPGGGSSVPAGQPGLAAEPAPPADLGQRVDRPADQTQRSADRQGNPESGNPRPRTNPPPPPPPASPPPSDGATRAEYEKAIQAAIQKYQSKSQGSNPRGGGNDNGGATGGRDTSGKPSGRTDSGGDGGPGGSTKGGDTSGAGSSMKTGGGKRSGGSGSTGSGG